MPFLKRDGAVGMCVGSLGFRL